MSKKELTYGVLIVNWPTTWATRKARVASEAKAVFMFCVDGWEAW
jgi:hypothetical protein